MESTIELTQQQRKDAVFALDLIKETSLLAIENGGSYFELQVYLEIGSPVFVAAIGGEIWDSYLDMIMSSKCRHFDASAKIGGLKFKNDIDVLRLYANELKYCLDLWRYGVATYDCVYGNMSNVDDLETVCRSLRKEIHQYLKPVY